MMEEKGKIAIDTESMSAVCSNMNCEFIDIINFYKKEGILLFSSIRCDGRAIESPVKVIEESDEKLYLDITEMTEEQLKEFKIKI